VEADTINSLVRVVLTFEDGPLDALSYPYIIATIPKTSYKKFVFEHRMTQLPDQIFNLWIRSYEEDSNGIIVYRPEEFKFPISRGRQAIEFRRDGTFIDWDIGSADGKREPVNGRWQMEGPRQVRVYFEGSRPSRILDLVQFDSEVLKVREQQSV
jgi:hypothetical protein